MKAHLTSITEHSDWLDNNFTSIRDKWELHRKRVEFGKQPLALWMFVPCDEDGNVLIETTQFDPDENSQYYAQQMWDNKQFQQAKERCLFEGFEVANNILFHVSGLDNSLLRKRNGKFVLMDEKYFNIESLICSRFPNIQLTTSAQKKLSL